MNGDEDTMGRAAGAAEPHTVVREASSEAAMQAGRECFDRYPNMMRVRATPDPEFERQMHVARELIRKNYNALRELAKS